MKKALCMMIAIMSVFLIFSALAADTDKFLGKWICYDIIMDGETIPIESIEAKLELAVRTDGTALIYIMQDHIEERFEGVWLANGNDMAVTDGLTSLLFSMNTEGNLILPGDGFEFILLHQFTLQIDEAHFPDEKFREFVKQYDFTNDGLLNDEEVKCARDFQLPDRDIGDMTGIEIFTNMTNLICSGNRLSKLDLRKNTKLKTLDCSSNQLTELNVSKCTKLTALSCGENQLKKLDVSKCKALRELGCGYNNLTRLNLNSNKKLERLWCEHNQLKSIQVSKNTKLIQLCVSYNQLTNIDVSHNASLLSLECTGNRLTNIDISQNPLLSGLYCSNNPLTGLDISRNTKLGSLFCEGCGLSKLDVSGHPGMRYLVCNNNRLTKLDVSANPELQRLECSNNLLTSLELSGNRKLNELNCSNNLLAALDVSKNMELNDYQLTCEGNCVQIGTNDGKIAFKDLPGFNIAKASDIRFTDDDGSEGTIKMSRKRFTVRTGGVIIYTYKADSKRRITRTFSIKVDFFKTAITSVTLRHKSYPYTGSPIEPAVTVKARVNGKSIKLSASDFTVTYENNIEPGTATVTVEGQGNYQGRITKTFTITPPDPESNFEQ